jgi:hypothetical protein
MTDEVDLTEEERLQAARELVIRNGDRLSQPRTMALDAHITLLADFAEC